MKFLGRARRFFRELASEPDSKVQYFNVTCASGHRVRGERTEGYQALRCPACGEGVFVLPRSPLPEPVAPGRAPARAKPGSRWVDEGPVELTDPGRVALEVGENEPVASDAEIIWNDAPAAPAAHPRGNHGRDREEPAGAGPADGDDPFWEEDLTRAAEPRPADPAPRRREKPGREGGPGPVDARPAPPPRGPATAAPRRTRQREAPAPIEIAPRRRTPTRLTALLVIVPLLVMTAVGWRIWRSRRAEYPLIAEMGKNEGIPALLEGDFDRAHQLLSAARSAVDALGGAVENAEEIRTADDEAAIFVDQCPQSLEEMLEEAVRSDPQRWASRFDALYKGRGILIDSTIKEEPGAGPASRCLLEYVILPPGGTNNFNSGAGMAPDRFGLIDFTGFKLFELAPPRKGNRVIFGARLASFQLDIASNVWRVGLEPDSGVFIVHTKALEAMGWPRTAETDTPTENRP